MRFKKKNIACTVFRFLVGNRLGFVYNGCYTMVAAEKV